MIQAAVIPPKTLEEVRSLENHITATTHAEATVKAANALPGSGQITSKKLFLESKFLVYEFYRVNEKDNKFYVIF